MYELWINTRIDGKVEDYILTCYDDYSEAKYRADMMNTKVEAYPDIVAWVVSNGCDQPSSSYRPKSIVAKAKLTPGIARRIRERVAAGERRADLAREYGVCASSITRIMKGQSFADEPAPRVVPANRKLDFETAEVIRKRIANGEKQADLAREYDLSSSSMSNIVNRKIYVEP